MTPWPRPVVERLVSKRRGLPRLRPTRRPPPCCSDAAFHELVSVANSRPERVLVRNDFLEEVLGCHLRAAAPGETLRQLTQRKFPSITYPGIKYAGVLREELFKFISGHGTVCPDNRRS